FDNVTALSAPGSQLASEFVPDTTIFTDERWRSHHERMSEFGFEIDFNELVYHYERSHIIEYLTERGWQVSHRKVAEMHAANGFVYPDDEVAAAFADVTYLNAMRR
ncbi:MAG: SAM-dependent methyltransferase, partial [Mycobacterium sp.]